MTPYYRVARALYRLVPRRVLRLWATEYLREQGGTAVYPEGASIVIIVGERLRMEYRELHRPDIEVMRIAPGDTVHLKMSGDRFGANFYKEKLAPVVPLPRSVRP